MSKTFVAILEVAAIVGVQFIPIPGLGQTIGAALAGSLGTSAAIGTAIATVAVAGAETVLNATLLAPGAPKPQSAEPTKLDAALLHELLHGVAPGAEPRIYRASLADRFQSDIGGQTYA